MACLYAHSATKLVQPRLKGNRQRKRCRENRWHSSSPKPQPPFSALQFCDAALSREKCIARWASYSDAAASHRCFASLNNETWLVRGDSPNLTRSIRSWRIPFASMQAESISALRELQRSHGFAITGFRRALDLLWAGEHCTR